MDRRLIPSVCLVLMHRISIIYGIVSPSSQRETDMPSYILRLILKWVRINTQFGGLKSVYVTESYTDTRTPGEGFQNSWDIQDKHESEILLQMSVSISIIALEIKTNCCILACQTYPSFIQVYVYQLEIKLKKKNMISYVYETSFIV